MAQIQPVKTKKQLESKLFRDNEKLQKCLKTPSEHVVPGSRGEHVGLIQQALVSLGVAVISANEISQNFFGSSTVSGVRRFKGPPRNIINKTYQNTPDDIVGQMTIERLDNERVELEKSFPTSVLVSVTEAGAPHDHSKCPRLQAGNHERTPINPQRFGRMINIFGDHETDYLGFKDFSTDINFIVAESGEVRPLTFELPQRGGLPDRCASDICMRSIPVKPPLLAEIKRIAMPGCRITFAGEEDDAREFFPLGPLIERLAIPVPVEIDGKVHHFRFNLAFVFVFRFFS